MVFGLTIALDSRWIGRTLRLLGIWLLGSCRKGWRSAELRGAIGGAFSSLW